ncbi:GIY-YIG nuclease family protein [Candidatus Roizmanbacteria bacterium]|nr:GIY-YIG nuclease family protein [Candidatus Roizmanbacteria bacterium]
MKETSNVSRYRTRYYVYILLSLKDKGFYIGYTADLKQRLTHHSKNQVIATKFRTPLFLIHYEYFVNEEDAKAREEFLKSGYGRNQMKQILKRTLFALKIQ